MNDEYGAYRTLLNVLPHLSPRLFFAAFCLLQFSYKMVIPTELDPE